LVVLWHVHLAVGHVGVSKAALEVLQVARVDAVLLLLGAHLIDRLDEVEELLGLAPPALGAHHRLLPDHSQLLYCGARAPVGNVLLTRGGGIEIWSLPTTTVEESSWGARGVGVLYPGYRGSPVMTQ
jgi:hypothetical protein